MIIVEERLTEVFEQLPEVSGGKPYFDFGNEEHLLKILKLFSDEGKSPYPILYLMSNEDDQNTRGNEVDHDVYLIIATRNTQTELTNKNRWAMSYRNVLFPTAELVVKCFNRAGIFTWDGNLKLLKYPNYGNGKENFTADIWDALVIKTKIIVTNNCIKQINFNL